MRFLARGVAATALALAAAAALIGVNAGAANAASPMSVRLAPLSNTGLTVEVVGGSYDNWATIDQWPVNSGSNQIWKFVPVGNAYEIVNTRSGRCMSAFSDGTAAFQFTCDGADLQLWYTTLQPGNAVGYWIQNKASTLYLNVSGGSGAQGATINTERLGTGLGQYFLGISA
ncbi:MAG TPA: RICIN domain-containing protein [Actinoplanes sp.]|jgi:hypothetical protein|nr:RICIN domain-containing protein [Actinoplanes sp.]